MSRELLAELRAKVIACVMPNLPAHLSGQNEGFGLSALESAAAGTPVVASNLGGLAEAVVENITGFLIEPLDPSAFAATINAIAIWSEEDRRQFAMRARQMVAERFTWDRVANDYLGEFERLALSRSLARN
jgi:glycosyltransferase involved in cell wall biosynthesis